MNNRDIKLAIADLKRETININYFLKSITTSPKDSASAKNLIAAKRSAYLISEIVRKEIDYLEKSITASIESESKEKFLSRIASINSPTAIMKKRAEDLLNNVKTSNQLSNEKIKKVGANEKSQVSVGSRRD